MSIKLFDENGQEINEDQNWKKDWDDSVESHSEDPRQLEFNFESNKLEFSFDE